jgi:hypothetical protein
MWVHEGRRTADGVSSWILDDYPGLSGRSDEAAATIASSAIRETPSNPVRTAVGPLIECLLEVDGRENQGDGEPHDEDD